MNEQINYSVPAVKAVGVCACHKIFIGCLLAGLVAFIVAAGMMYCSGRWDFSVGPELFFAKGAGLIVYVFACIVLLKIFEKKANSSKFAAVCLGFFLLLASFSLAANLMMKSYVAGFEQAVFSVATVEQWNAVPAVVKKNKMDPSKNRGWAEHLLPDFVGKVYPGVYFVTTTSEGKTTTDRSHTLINWRGRSLDLTLAIGQWTANAPNFSKTFYRKDYSTNISFVVIDNPD